MHLSAQPGSAWVVERKGADFFVARLRDDPRLSVSYGPLVPAPIDHARWITAVLGEDLPEGAAAEIVASEEARTEHGWSVLLVRTRTSAGARLTALYAPLLNFAAVAVARADDEALLEHDALRAFLLSAGPEWADGPVTLDDLFDGVPE